MRHSEVEWRPLSCGIWYEVGSAAVWGRPLSLSLGRSFGDGDPGLGAMGPYIHYTTCLGGQQFNFAYIYQCAACRFTARNLPVIHHGQTVRALPCALPPFTAPIPLTRPYSTPWMSKVSAFKSVHWARANKIGDMFVGAGWVLMGRATQNRTAWRRP